MKIVFILIFFVCSLVGYSNDEVRFNTKVFTLEISDRHKLLQLEDLDRLFEIADYDAVKREFYFKKPFGIAVHGENEWTLGRDPLGFMVSENAEEKVVYRDGSLKTKSSFEDAIKFLFPLPPHAGVIETINYHLFYNDDFEISDMGFELLGDINKEDIEYSVYVRDEPFGRRLIFIAGRSGYCELSAFLIGEKTDSVVLPESIISSIEEKDLSRAEKDAILDAIVKKIEDYSESEKIDTIETDLVQIERLSWF
ncbi:MAG: hypothetical protein JJT75_01945 [Opitutales bacterium]|nr:hypothetical protein [Opitutales bacterium]MCH8540678.1 hypothetical protein [Opitutales bacterium]